MKNLIACTAIVCFLFSCQKEVTKQYDSTAVSNTEQLMFNKIHSIVFDTITTQAFTTTLYDSCYKENINLNGTEIFKYKRTSSPEGDEFIYAETDLTGVTGTGETSGIFYKGGGVIRTVNRVVTEKILDTTYSQDSIVVNARVIARNTYRLKFTSKRDDIILTALNIYKEVNGKVIIDHTGYPVEIACKSK